MRGAVAVLAALAALTATIAASGATRGDFGPDTCLNGWVWREAVTDDHVCVTPEIRTQTARENALAPSRRSPNGGPFGPDTCLQGYVWREAVTGDHVCVAASSRDQARSDNAAAAGRRDELRTTVGTYGLARYYLVQTDRINTGKARVYLFDATTRKTIRYWPLVVPANPSGAPGGLIVLRTAVGRCTGAALNAYFRVWDGSSTRWSSRRYVCAKR